MRIEANRKGWRTRKRMAEARREMTMKDETEAVRRQMLERGQTHLDLAKAEQRWTTEELGREFIVHSFLAPFVRVTRVADGVLGTMEFTHSPRFYFNFEPDPPSGKPTDGPRSAK
jgi:hypothetical protein